MKELCLARSYPKIIANNQIYKVIFGRDQSVRKTLESGILFATAYYSKVKELRELIMDLLAFLYTDEEVQKLFSPPPMVSYTSARKIKDYIVRSKLYLVER